MMEQSKEVYTLPEKERQEIYEKLNYEYPYIESSKVPTKTSVTKLKERENIEEYNADIEDLVKDISKEILSGKIDIKPYNKNGYTPCRYCIYKSICCFNTKQKNNTYNYIEKKSKDDVITQMKKCCNKEKNE